MLIKKILCGISKSNDFDLEVWPQWYSGCSGKWNAFQGIYLGGKHLVKVKERATK